jgi:hypothetical protein
LNNPLTDDEGNITVPAQVAGGGGSTLFRWTPQIGQFQTFGGFNSADVRGLNDAGAMCGSTLSGKPATRVPMRLTALPAQLLSKTYGPWGQDINSHGDVLINGSGSPRGAIFRDDWAAYGYYGDLSKLVVDTTGVWSSALHASCLLMNDRGSTGACQIAGYLTFRNGSTATFQLIPIPIP